MAPIRDPRSIKRDEDERVGTLGDLKRNGLDIRLFCLACDRTTDLDIEDLVARYDAATPVQDIYDRFRCSGCGRPADQMHVANRAPPMVPREDGR